MSGGDVVRTEKNRVNRTAPTTHQRRGERRRHQDGPWVVPEPSRRDCPRPGHPTGAWRWAFTQGRLELPPTTAGTLCHSWVQEWGPLPRGIGTRPTDGT